MNIGFEAGRPPHFFGPNSRGRRELTITQVYLQAMTQMSYTFYLDFIILVSGG
jgi:hypothetical protein